MSTTTPMTPLERAAEEQREEARRDQRIRIAMSRRCSAACVLPKGHDGEHMRQDGTRITAALEVRAEALTDLDTIIGAAQAARLDAQLVAEWRQHQHETVLERITRLRLNPNFVLGYIVGALPIEVSLLLDQIESTIDTLPAWAVQS